MRLELVSLAREQTNAMSQIVDSVKDAAESVTETVKGAIPDVGLGRSLGGSPGGPSTR